MKTFGDIFLTYGRILTLALFCADIFLLFQFIKSINAKIDKKFSFLAGFNFVLCTFVSSVFLHVQYLETDNIIVIDKLREWVFNLPLWLVLLLLTFVVLLAIVDLIKQKSELKKHISGSSIKESLDLLPSGIVVYDSERTLMCNVMMDKLCRNLTGMPLVNPARFWQILQQKSIITNGENEALIRFDDDEVYAFYQSEIAIDGNLCKQIVEANVTKQYKLSLLLQQQNEQLKIMQQRMKAYGKNVDEVAHKQEVLNAKMAVHNDLGQVLMMTKYSLDHIESLNLQSVADMWKKNIAFLVSEARQNRDNLLQELVLTAKSVGIDIVLHGSIAENSAFEKIFYQALHECITNTLKYAEGDKIDVFIENKRFVFANNGIAPKGKIEEKGGLRSLRKVTQNLGGTMEIESFPVFKLIISF